jgi:hypothetical protein
LTIARAADFHRAGDQVYILPVEGSNLADAHPSSDHETDEVRDVAGDGTLVVCEETAKLSHLGGGQGTGGDSGAARHRDAAAPARANVAEAERQIQEAAVASGLSHAAFLETPAGREAYAAFIAARNAHRAVSA